MTFNKILEDISNKHRLVQVFDDFLIMSVSSFTMGKMEDVYLDTASKYDKEDLTKMANALGALIMDYDKQSQEGSWNDLLGDYFMEIQSNMDKSSMGQFFTPVSVCQMMAQLTDDGEATEGSKVADPTCGSSRNLIAHSRLHPKNRFNTFYYGMDLDRRCVLMSVLHYVLYGMKGVVIHMNTLSMEIYSGFRIYLPETGMMVAPLNENQCRQFMHEANDEAEKIEVNEKTGQITMNLE